MSRSPPRNRALVRRDPLKPREEQLNLAAEVGRYKVVTADTPLAERGGFYCKACDCLVKDSAAYLDHVNGKRHQRNLGMSMRVDKASLSQVRDRLKFHKRKREEERAGGGAGAGGSVAERLARLEAEQEDKKKKKKEERAKKRRRKQLAKAARAAGEPLDEAALGDDDPAAAEAAASAPHVAANDATASSPAASRSLDPFTVEKVQLKSLERGPDEE